MFLPSPMQLLIALLFLLLSTVFPTPSYYSYSFEYSSLSSRQSGECDCRRGCFSFQVINQSLYRKYQYRNPFFSMVCPLLAFWAGTSGPQEQSRMWEGSKWLSDTILVKPFKKGGWVDIKDLKRISVMLLYIGGSSTHPVNSHCKQDVLHPGYSKHNVGWM